MRRILAATAVLFLITAACGDDDGSAVRDVGDSESGSGSGSGTASGESTDAPVELEGTVNNHGNGEAGSEPLELELDNFYFAPTVTKAAKGTTIEVELTNEGDAPHTFTIDSLGIDEELQPGDSTTVSIEVPDDDTAVRYYCRFHEGQGMQGALYTADGATVSAN